MMSLLLLALGGTPAETILFGESDGLRFAVRGTQVREFSRFPTLGGNMPFSFDLSETCRLLLVDHAESNFSLKSLDLSRSDAKTVTILTSTVPITNPRWSNDGTRLAFVLTSKNSSKVRVVRSSGGEPTEFSGDGFVWLRDESLVVHDSRRVDGGLCHVFSRIAPSGAVAAIQHICAGLNTWFPVSGYPDEIAPVMVDEVGSKWSLTIHDSVLTRTEVELDEHSLWNATACGAGVSFVTNPPMSLLRASSQWGFLRGDVCNAPSVSLLPPTLRDRSWRKLQSCVPR